VEQDLFLTMGGLAWGVTIRKRRDRATGAEVPVHWDDYTPLLIAKPEPFEFDVVPRSPEKLERMREMYEAALRDGEGQPDMDISQFEKDLGEVVYKDEVTDRLFSGPPTSPTDEPSSEAETQTAKDEWVVPTAVRLPGIHVPGEWAFN
jgi:hypothetical protein